jgi:hypothetical protein
MAKVHAWALLDYEAAIYVDADYCTTTTPVS